jgi:hypothetical protein
MLAGLRIIRGNVIVEPPSVLIIVGNEVGVADVWLTGVEYRGPESTQDEVIGVEPEYAEPDSS